MTVRTICPAKINTFLAVGRLDANGYHPLRTVFHAVSLADELVVEQADEDGFVCEDPGVPPENTVTRAWRLAREYVGFPPLSVTLTKRVPALSGLGGGSSDAAGLLRALEVFSKGALSRRETSEIALAVGADVPFFLMGGAARGEAYGQCLTPLPDGAPRHLVVAMPSIGSSTPEAFARLDALDYEWRSFPEDPWELYNDFERVVPAAALELTQRLRDLGAKAGLTGSGSASFGVFSDEAAAAEAASRLEGEDGVRAWACRTLTRKESLWTS
ncbi:MAG: 4-(cytidine 5'-diphospho)-2-C-methyl-D-erythritol kinase [Fimbriimonadaceae bacterium]|nr:4-(cytidine 5'-diphospho)-2-C-methyl-D-erythritol kinase [Fimbriimonadaceae bacterium]QYK55947.1 MAG: 4-(cytidine 5'-diphospho)-2-C-methyl-D-erythritol kinase [Fimbriimonadaceae bacterium]